MDGAEYTIIILNLVLGLSLAFPLSKLLAKTFEKKSKVFRYFASLVAVYLIECVAFSAGMATNLFTVALAIVWGLILGLSLRSIHRPGRELLKTSFYFSLYTSLPAVSFLSIFVLLIFQGWPILTSEGGIRFGVPAFVPWPFNTLLGFFLSVAISAVILKSLITTGMVGLLLRGDRTREA